MPLKTSLPVTVAQLSSLVISRSTRCAILSHGTVQPGELTCNEIDSAGYVTLSLKGRNRV
jgi:hypothetical protein